MTQPLILVTGATGTVGTETVRRLTEAGRRRRALVRDPAKAAKADARAEIVVGDLADPKSLAPAFSGVEAAFVISNGAELDRLEGNAFEGAKQAGGRHIVKLSGRPMARRERTAHQGGVEITHDGPVDAPACLSSMSTFPARRRWKAC
jgi:nucleoside-diphosphate-sugar epimerase